MQVLVLADLSALCPLRSVLLEVCLETQQPLSLQAHGCVGLCEPIVRHANVTLKETAAQTPYKTSIEITSV